MTLRTSRRRRLAAKSLLEMVIIVSISSVALMLSATTLAALFRLERQQQGSAAHRQSLTRLSSRWRADVHAAIEGKVDRGCELVLADGRTIHYAIHDTIAPPEISREVRRAGAVLHRDAFVFAPQSRFEFSTAGDRTAGKPPGQLLQLTIRPGELPARRFQAIAPPVSMIAALHLHPHVAAAGDAP